MKITTDQELITYLGNVYANSPSRYRELIEKSRVVGNEVADRQYQKNRKNSEKQKQIREAKSLELFEKVNEGDVVQMYGTRDNQGYRLVLKKKAEELECQKLSFRGKKSEGVPILLKEPYITEHFNTKIKRIIDFKVKIKDKF